MKIHKLGIVILTNIPNHHNVKILHRSFLLSSWQLKSEITFTAKIDPAPSNCQIMCNREVYGADAVLEPFMAELKNLEEVTILSV